MSPSLRACAPLILLLALLSGHAAGGVVLAHVIQEHGATATHGHPHDAGETHRPASDHAHDLLPATISAPARMACPETVIEPCVVVRTDALPMPDDRGATHCASPPAHGDPPAPQRRLVLLI